MGPNAPKGKKKAPDSHPVLSQKLVSDDGLLGRRGISSYRVHGCRVYSYNGRIDSWSFDSDLGLLRGARNTHDHDQCKKNGTHTVG